jgi:AAA domain, putative AbiEii toxin, Type IV TA system/AAA ATPase domain
MYIQKVEIKNIRSITGFEMNFSEPVGWHVLIGDNGVGKSTIIRSIALGLLGEDHAKALSFAEEFSNWLPPSSTKGSIEISVSRDNIYDKPAYKMSKDGIAVSTISIEKKNGSGKVELSGTIKPLTALWGKGSLSGWFTAAYGPFRRLRGGSDVFSHLNSSKPRLGACISAFRDDVALTQLTAWLKDLALDASKKPKAQKELKGIIKFINESKLLPNGATLLDDIDSEGIRLRDANGVKVSLYEMSDGYRSILSMTLDIIRFLIEIYGTDKVFENDKQEVINLPGVVLIDEIDAHLHPTWQTRVGQWFTKYFPNIQFIVTTHSPLVCRACDKGSIWRLAAQGSSQESGEIIGLQKERLIFGNILDAYGTEVFGSEPVRSEESEDKLNRLGRLNIKFALGKTTKLEETERLTLQQILSTDAPTGF